ncbi:QsdR family transcriptional regulator [Nocardioides sp.]|uniref:QsdR family transcriptional regulator n=1 Tax=Nocardioides sp. TaxID=35761 RepID=UPI002BAD0F29|nr:QsdR family transcriptional regulator [Nocardioides sp.]HSX66762.1 QsdR family transcriptional regulator [Nocardioides sp.]
MSQTPLARMLADGEHRPDALAAFKLARRRFMAGERLEMQEIASDLGVSRATLFRWVGSRDELLVEIVWSTTLPTYQRALEATSSQSGGARVAEVMSHFAALTVESPFFMDFVQREPERSLRLLTTKASWFQARLVGLIEGLLRAEVESGALTPPLAVHDLAYVVTRITETFIYADVVAGELPDPAKVRQIVGALLRD